jgi:hypothetical protein
LRAERKKRNGRRVFSPDEREKKRAAVGRYFAAETKVSPSLNERISRRWGKGRKKKREKTHHDRFVAAFIVSAT